MQDIIQLLPDAIANQIAAGEVVQRPASAVKELLENALDAKASQITLIVKEAGKTLIQVIDDGIGMSETDARMCFERHATSKIRKSEDLFTLTTMGFRGEAMASIAAIAQVEMRSRRAVDELGILLKIEASELKTQEPTQTPIGTNILVKNLFFNVPARRNFLKANPVEMRHVIDEFQRVALANPGIAFTMYNTDNEVYNLPIGKLSKRIVDLFGKNYQQQLAPCQEDTDFVKVTGYIGKPDFAKKTKSEQFFFVNGRFIKSGYLHHAVMTAYADLIEEGSHPFYVIFLEIDPKHIDINVHPTKTEIKFDDERSVYAIVSAASRKAMSQYNLLPSIDFESETSINFLPFPEKTTRPEFKSDGIHSFEKNGPQKANLGNWQSLYEGFAQTGFEKKPAEEQQELIYKSGLNDLNFENNITLKSKLNGIPNASFLEPTGLLCLQINQQYILTQVKSGLLIIDQKAAFERVFYDRYENILSKNNQAPSQTLLFPETVTLNAGDYQLILEIETEITALGFLFSTIGGNTLIINGMPSEIGDETPQEIIENLIEQFKNFQSDIKLNIKENILKSFAKRIASKKAMTLTNTELTALVDQLFASQNPQFTPSGNTTMRIVTTEILAGIIEKGI